MLLLHSLQQITHGPAGLQRMAEGGIQVHMIDVASALFFGFENSGFDELSYDALYGAFGDAYLLRGFAHGEGGITGKTDEYVTVVA